MEAPSAGGTWPLAWELCMQARRRPSTVYEGKRVPPGAEGHAEPQDSIGHRTATEAKQKATPSNSGTGHARGAGACVARQQEVIDMSISQFWTPAGSPEDSLGSSRFRSCGGPSFTYQYWYR